MSSSRVLFFDATKLLAISLVLYGHCIQHLMSGSELENYGYLIIYSFHMPLFMMLSGYFSHSAMSLSASQFIIKKARQLLLPYLTWGGVIILTRILIDEQISVSTIVRDDLWFLKSLFLCMLLTYIAMSCNKRYRPIVLVLFVILTQVSLFRMKDMFVPFLAGYYLKNFWDYVDGYRPILFCCFMALFVTLGLIYINPSFFEVQRDSILEYTIKQLSVLVIGICGSMAVILMMSSLSNRIPQRICNLGKYTLGIYLIQSVLLETIISHFISSIEMNRIFVYMAIFPIICLMIISLSVYIVRIIESNRILALLMFGKK